MIDEKTIVNLRLLALLHNIGKIGIPEKILFKQGPLTDDEYKIAQKHCEIGYEIVKLISNLEHADLVLKHHEWWNGEGYPLGIKGTNIPVECRILSILDTYDVITNYRPYTEPFSHEEAINEIKRCSGTHFDPYWVRVFINRLAP